MKRILRRIVLIVLLVWSFVMGGVGLLMALDAVDLETRQFRQDTVQAAKASAHNGDAMARFLEGQFHWQRRLGLYLALTALALAIVSVAALRRPRTPS